MFKQNSVDAALTRLSHYFGNTLIMQPPAAAAAIAQLEQIDGGLPKDLITFLTRCNGLRIGKGFRDTELQLWGTHEILATMLSPSGPDVPNEFLPIHGDPTGERDWLILDDEPIRGAIVRWDPWLPSADLVGSSFGAFLGSWVEHLLQTHTPDGRIRETARPTPVFDPLFCEKHDVHLAALRQNAGTIAWLKNIALTVACGDDYE